MSQDANQANFHETKRRLGIGGKGSRVGTLTTVLLGEKTSGGGGTTGVHVLGLGKGFKSISFTETGLEKRGLSGGSETPSPGSV